MNSLYAGVAAMVAASMVSPSTEGKVINTKSVADTREVATQTKYTNARVNFRYKGSLESDVITVLEPNTTVTLHADKGGWSYVEVGACMGYIYSSYLSDTETEIPQNRWHITLSSSEIDLLAQIVWVEARGEDLVGQKAVTEVIFNRIISDKFPDTLYEVLSQKSQFSSWDDHYDVIPGTEQYEAINDVLNGNTNILSTEVIYFSTFPRNNNLEIVIGNHYFCRED